MKNKLLYIGGTALLYGFFSFFGFGCAKKPTDPSYSKAFKTIRNEAFHSRRTLELLKYPQTSTRGAFFQHNGVEEKIKDIENSHGVEIGIGGSYENNAFFHFQDNGRNIEVRSFSGCLEVEVDNSKARTHKNGSDKKVIESIIYGDCSPDNVFFNNPESKGEYVKFMYHHGVGFGGFVLTPKDIAGYKEIQKIKKEQKELLEKTSRKVAGISKELEKLRDMQFADYEKFFTETRNVIAGIIEKFGSVYEGLEFEKIVSGHDYDKEFGYDYKLRLIFANRGNRLTARTDITEMCKDKDVIAEKAIQEISLHEDGIKLIIEYSIKRGYFNDDIASMNTRYFSREFPKGVPIGINSMSIHGISSDDIYTGIITAIRKNIPKIDGLVEKSTKDFPSCKEFKKRKKEREIKEILAVFKEEFPNSLHQSP